MTAAADATALLAAAVRATTLGTAPWRIVAAVDIAVVSAELVNELHLSRNA